MSPPNSQLPTPDSQPKTQNSKLPTPHSRLKVCVLGTRGFPNVQGGVENHCEHLYPELVKMGCNVTVFTRKPYASTLDPITYCGLALVPLPCTKSKHFEAIIHTFKGVFAAKKLKPDILHIHAIGPSLLTPLAKMLGMKVVVTHHGPDYKRAKWEWFAKLALRIGEWAGVTFADEVITISETIADDLKKRFGISNITVIPNGVTPLEPTTSSNYLKDMGLTKGRYILAVGRFVPEKGFHDLIEAFNMMQDNSRPQTPNSSLPTPDSQLQIPKLKLVLVGDADHEDSYSLDLKEKARKNTNIVLTGFLTGEPLQELYSHAALFVLPSYYEGLPIALLEAMSYGLSCIASDIPANRIVGLSDGRYFKAGDKEGLSKNLKEFISKPLTEEEKSAQIQRIAEQYNWEKIASKTLEVYKNTVNSPQCSVRSSH